MSFSNRNAVLKSHYDIDEHRALCRGKSECKSVHQQCSAVEARWHTPAPLRVKSAPSTPSLCSCDLTAFIDCRHTAPGCSLHMNAHPATKLGCDALARAGAGRPIPGSQPAWRDARCTESSRCIAKNSGHHMFLSNKLASNTQHAKTRSRDHTPRPRRPTPFPPSPAVHSLEAGSDAQQHALVPARAMIQN